MLVILLKQSLCIHYELIQFCFKKHTNNKAVRIDLHMLAL